MSSKSVLQDLQAYVDGAVGEYGAPALSIAIWNDNRLYRAASGVLNVETGVEATVDSVFQIGSITKVFTASLIMLLVDEGKVELDKLVKEYLQGFHVADPHATETITARHLLCHSSGLISDPTLDPDDPYDEEGAIERYVDRCFLLPQSHRQIGKMFSYSNAAYVMLGRVVELVSGFSWWRAIEKCIFEPLNMTQSLCRPTEVLRFRAALGHFVAGRGRDRRVSVAPYCYLPSGMAPTGSTLTTSASDLVKFGRAHLSGGMTESGSRWMSNESVKAMQASQVALPVACRTLERSWGLGWNLWDCQGVQGFGHGGGTGGQEALLQVIPEHDCVVSIQSNGSQLPGLSFVRQVLADILYEIAKVRPAESMRAQPPGDLMPLTGTFGAGAWRFEITQQDGKLRARIKAEGVAAPQMYDLEFVGGDRFAMFPAGDREMPADHLTFLERDHIGIPKYLFWGYRLHPRMHMD
jgi:CubicO group peptidase (beta-lactamase class C family)